MLPRLAVSMLCGLLASGAVVTRAGVDPVPPRSSRLDSKKQAPAAAPDESSELPPLLGTLLQVHGGKRLAFDERTPSQTEFDALLADRVTGAEHAIDPRLLDLLHRLAAKHAGARIEILSGFRSEKLNEMLRKKGHHVATHSQHSLGHAVDFRIVEASALDALGAGAGQSDAGSGPGACKAIDPRAMEQEIRALGWEGGVGVYTLESDWFVHADVGPNRRWNGY